MSEFLLPPSCVSAISCAIDDDGQMIDSPELSDVPEEHFGRRYVMKSFPTTSDALISVVWRLYSQYLIKHRDASSFYTLLSSVPADYPASIATQPHPARRVINTSSCSFTLFERHVYARGWNQYGRLGVGSLSPHISDWSLVILPEGCVIEDIRIHHTAVYYIGNTVQCCGLNSCGQLGIGYQSRCSPVVPNPLRCALPGLPLAGSTRSAKDRVTRVWTTDKSSYIELDYAIYSCGNNNGSLFLGDHSNRITPELTPLFDVDNLYLGTASAGVVIDGQLHMIGSTRCFGLGRGRVAVPYPINLPDSSRVESVVCLARGTLVQTTSGLFYCGRVGSGWVSTFTRVATPDNTPPVSAVYDDALYIMTPDNVFRVDRESGRGGLTAIVISCDIQTVSISRGFIAGDRGEQGWGVAPIADCGAPDAWTPVPADACFLVDAGIAVLRGDDLEVFDVTAVVGGSELGDAHTDVDIHRVAALLSEILAIRWKDGKAQTASP